MTDIEKAVSLLRSRGFKPAGPLTKDTLFFQDERGSATIDPILGSVEIAEPVDGLEAILSPSPSPSLTAEEVKALTWALDLMGDCAAANTLRSLLARLQQHTQTTPDRLFDEEQVRAALAYTESLWVKRGHIREFAAHQLSLTVMDVLKHPRVLAQAVGATTKEGNGE